MNFNKKQGSNSGANTYLIVPIVIFFILLIFAVIRGPYLVSNTGIGGLIIVVAPLILATYALTIIVMAGRASVDLAIGPLIGFINVGMIQLIGAGYIESPIAVFLYAMGVGVAYQVLTALIIVFVRVQPIIVSLSGYLSLVGLNLIIMPRPTGLAPDWMYDWGAGTSIFSPVLVILVVATIGWYLLAQTAFFGNLKMMGSDERATYTSGVNINLVRVGAHVVGAIYTGLAAITFTSMISSGDPTQGTTYTLMAVTALVLGGANLAGGRGSAFGALLGSLNIFLITFALSTFNFGKMQSFITDMSYGLMLVVSLLISIAIPLLQKRARGLSPGLVFLVMGVVALGVMVSVSMDQATGIKRFAMVVASTASTEEPYSVGTIILFMIIGIAFLAFALKTLFKFMSLPMVGLMTVLIITIFGLVFSPETTKGAATAIRNVASVDYYSMSVYGLETIAHSTTSYFSVGALANSTYMLLALLGVVLLSSLIILTMLPQVADKIKRLAIILLIGAVPIIAISAIFFQDADKGYLFSNFSSEIYAVLMVGLLLFIITAPLVQTKVRNINNLFIGALSILAFIVVYFFARKSSLPVEELTSSGEVYANSIIQSIQQAVPPTPVEYGTPVRVSTESQGMALYSELAYSTIIVVLLQIFIRLAMGESSFQSFWKYWHIALFAVLTWSSLFFAVGVPFWKIIAIIGIAIISAPIVMKIMDTYVIDENKDNSTNKL